MYQDPKTLQKKNLQDDLTYNLDKQTQANLGEDESFGTALALFYQHKHIYMSMMKELADTIRPALKEMCSANRYDDATTYCYRHMPDCSARVMLLNNILKEQEAYEIQNKTHVYDSFFAGITNKQKNELLSLPQLNIVYTTRMGNGKVFKTVLDNPTEESILEMANDAIKYTEDFHHVFFEGFTRNEDGTFKLIMGS